MRKLKWMMLPTFVLIAALCLTAITPKAKADANLIENGSVVYAWLKNADDLRTYIDEEGLYSSKDNLQEKEYSNTYKIVLEEPGQLILAPLSNISGVSFYLYSDFNLVSQLAKMNVVESSRESFGVCRVTAGTYYYRLYSQYNSGNATVFIGFIPDSGKIKTEWSFQEKDNSTGNVNVVPVTSTDELASYIDHDGKPACIILQEAGQVSETYQFTVNEPGVLTVCPIVSGYSSATIRLFSNIDLSSRLLNENFNKSSMDPMPRVRLEPGTYYYNVYDRYHNTEAHIYLGYITDSERMTDRYATIPNHNGETHIKEMDSIDDLKLMIQNGEYTYSDQVLAGTPSETRKIVLDETSLIYIFSVSDNTSSLRLYTNQELDSCIETMDSNRTDQNDHTIHSFILDPGEYYLNTYNPYHNTKTYVYLGYTPVSKVFSVDSITLSDDKSSATVKFAIADDYNPDQYKAQVRIEKGIVRTRSILSTAIWKDNTRENAIESHEFVATENGVYTARISGNGLQPYLLTFKVTGINGDYQDPDDSVLAVVPEAATAEDSKEAETPAETNAPSETEAPQEMTPSELRKYIRTLEDQIEDLGLELPEFAASDTQDEYMKKLEKVLQDNGYDI